MHDVEQGLERIGVAGKEYAKAQTAFKAAEENQKIVLSEQIIKAGAVPLAKAEHIARGTFEYREAADALTAARGIAEELRAELDYLTKRWETWRTRMATEREKLKQGRTDG